MSPAVPTNTTPIQIARTNDEPGESTGMMMREAKGLRGVQGLQTGVPAVPPAGGA